MNTDFPNKLPEGAKEYLSDHVNSTNFGITVGAGLDFGHLSLGVRYDAGLTDTFENSNVTKLLGVSDAKFGVLSIVAGIGF